MTPTEIIPWLTLVLSSVAVLGHLKGWVNSGEKKLLEDVSGLKAAGAALEKKLIEHDRRIQSVESDIRHLPSRDSQHKIELALAEMNGRFAALEEKLKPISATSERLHELLMEQANK